MQQTIRIAVLVTCHNRRELSLSCLRSLYSSLASFNGISDVPLQAKVYLVDDNVFVPLQGYLDTLVRQRSGNIKKL